MARTKIQTAASTAGSATASGARARGGGGRSAKALACAHNAPLERKLEEMYDELREKGKDRLMLVVGRALKSVRLTPEPITSVAEAKKVKYVGDYVARALKGAIAEANRNSGVDQNSRPNPNRSANPNPNPNPEPNPKPKPKPKPKPRSSRDFSPNPDESTGIFLRAVAAAAAANPGRGGSHATLDEVRCFGETMASHAGVADGVFEGMVERVAVELQARRLVAIDGRAQRRTFALTASGRAVTERIGVSVLVPPQKLGSHSRDIGNRRLQASDAQPPPRKRLRPAERDAMRLEDMSVVLVQDVREGDKNIVQSHLLELGVACENRQLTLGDMLWLARDPYTGAEYVLDFIVERKSIVDLAVSIMDGRYEEQKRRLKGGGPRRVTYLVEGALATQDRVPPSAIKTAMAETALEPNFRILRTDNIAQTAEELRRLHEEIKALMKLGGADAQRLFAPNPYPNPNPNPKPNPKPGADCGAGYLSFKDFLAESRKPTATAAGEIFGRMLCQIPGISAVAAAGILQHYPTLRAALDGVAGLTAAQAADVLRECRSAGASRAVSAKAALVLGKVLTQVDYGCAEDQP